MCSSVLIDTNIILDVLCDRKPFSDGAKTIFKLCETNLLHGYISALSIPNIVYILRKEISRSEVQNIVQMLSLIFEIADIKATDLQKAAISSIDDYEDALQTVCAKRVGAEFIITRNVRDFVNSEITAVTPTEFIGSIKD